MFSLLHSTQEIKTKQNKNTSCVIQTVPSRNAQCINFDGIIKGWSFLFFTFIFGMLVLAPRVVPLWPQNDIRWYVIKLKKRSHFLPWVYYYQLGETSAGNPLLGCLSCIIGENFLTCPHLNQSLSRENEMAIIGTNRDHWSWGGDEPLLNHKATLDLSKQGFS